MTDVHQTPSLLAEILEMDDATPFALIARESGIDVLAGTIVTVDTLADIPLRDRETGEPDVLALVPFRQISERGFHCHDDASPLTCLVVDRHEHLTLADALTLLPVGALEISDGTFEPEDDAYARIVERIISDEIGAGAGANFVIRRDFLASVHGSRRASALELFRRLLVGEQGAYWTHVVHTPHVTLVGASPERHVSSQDSVVRMNPISGTYRHPESGPSGEEFLRFLSDAKERDELFMVVDEELKMMSRVCDHGGRVLGPFVKQMGHLTHTEYVLTGSSDLDPREVLRQTMFAPTVTGSPIENAARVIERYESTGRGYYSGVLALFTGGSGGRSDVDAPILIRTAELTDDANNTALKLSVGATLVRGSTPADEVAETRSKLGGVLAALGITPPRPGREQAVDLASYPGVAQALSSRNDTLASFWIQEQSAPDTTFSGARALVVDCEDQWTDMLAHQLRHLGMEVTIVRWNELLPNGTEVGHAPEFDLLVCGPGPGDPRRTGDTRIQTIEAIMRARLRSGLPLLAVCLSHQILARVLGLSLHALPTPDQGTQREIELFGERTTVGFYNTFLARQPGPSATMDFELSADPVTGAVHALRGNGFHSIQFHAESLLSTNGIGILGDIVERLLSSAAVA